LLLLQGRVESQLDTLFFQSGPEVLIRESLALTLVFVDWEEEDCGATEGCAAGLEGCGAGVLEDSSVDTLEEDAVGGGVEDDVGGGGGGGVEVDVGGGGGGVEVDVGGGSGVVEVDVGGGSGVVEVVVGSVGVD